MTFDPTSAQPEGAFDPTSATPDAGGPDTRTVLRTSVPVKPDDASEAVRLAKRYPQPADVLLRNLQDAKLQAAVDDADARLRTSPKLAEHMRNNPWTAKQAHDDIPALTQVESGIGAVTAASIVQSTLGISESIWRTPDAAQRAVGTFAQGLENLTGLPRDFNPVRGVQDIIRLVSEGQLPTGTKFMAGTTDAANAIRNSSQLLSSDTSAFGQSFADVATLGQNADKALATLLSKGSPEQVKQVITDPKSWAAFMANALPSLYTAIKSGGSQSVLYWLEGMDTANNAAEFEQRTGIPISDAEFTQAVAQTALVNGWLEKVGLDRVLGGAAGSGLRGVLSAMFGEGGTEALQQFNSNLAQWLAYNKDQSLSEGVLASALGGAASGGGVHSATLAAEHMQRKVAELNGDRERAGAYAQALEQTLKAAEASALRERNPEAFRSLMAELSDNGTVYVDAEVLNQMPASVLQQMQGVADELPAALATGGTVGVKLADAMTLLAGTPQAELFMQHARVQPNAPSAFEAEQAGKKAGEFLKQEAERVLADAQDQEAARADSEAVKQNLLDQLNTAGRHSPAVNEGLATWAGAFYTTMAARTGMTAQEFYQRFPLRILAEASPGGQAVMDQPGTPAFDNWFGDSKVVDAEGKPLVLHHGTPAKGLRVFDAGKIGTNGRAEGAGFYFTTDRKTAEGYGQRGETLDVHLSIKKPLHYDAKPFSQMQVRKLLSEVAKVEAANTGTDWRDGFLSNYVDTYSATLDAAVREAAKAFDGEESALDQVSGIVGSGVDADTVNTALTKALGYDGYFSRGFSGEGAGGGDIWVAMRSEQVKSATGNSGAYDPENPDIYNQSAYHGTPHRGIEQFSTDKIGTGEGAQAYGWGLYFASKREIAEWYRETTTGDGFLVADRKVFDPSSLQHLNVRGIARRGDLDAAIDKAKSIAESDSPVAAMAAHDLAVLEDVKARGGISKNPGQLYEVEIPDDEHMLLWDKPLSEQPAAVREVALELAADVYADEPRYNPDYTRGMELYRDYSRKFGALGSGDKAASEALAAAGIKGIKYLDGTSRNAGDGSFNYVVFSGDDVQIKQQFYQRTASTGPRGTFNPRTLELVLSPTADLSTFFHETGHFFLEVMGDLASQPGAPVQVVDDMNKILAWFGIKGDEQVGGADSGVPLGQSLPDFAEMRSKIAQQEKLNAQRPVDHPLRAVGERTLARLRSEHDAEAAKHADTLRALEGTKIVDARGNPLVVYHGGPSGISESGRFRRKEDGRALWFSDARVAGTYAGKSGATYPAYLSAKNPLVFDAAGATWQQLEFEGQRLSTDGLADIAEQRGHDALVIKNLRDEDNDHGGDEPADHYAVFNPKQIVSAISGEVLGQGGPQTPAQPVTPRRTPLETWRSMTLDQQRPYHERWAESIEQYVMEGKAPSAELQGPMRRFAAWLKSVYGSIKQFLAMRGVATSGPVLGQMPAPEGVLTDDDGKPLVVYHGTSSAFEKFSRIDGGNAYGPGYYFTADPAQASGYATGQAGDRIAPKGNAAPNVIPAFVKAGNVFALDGRVLSKAEVGKLEAASNKLNPGAWKKGELAKAFDRAYQPTARNVMQFITEQAGGTYTELAQAAGFDALRGSFGYVIFDPKRIVSAISGEVLGQGDQPTPSNIQLNDDIRRVMDRMLATDEQIAQANEMAGLSPDEDADAQAAERLRKRSMADLKWAVAARDKVIAKLRKQARAIEKDIREQVTVEVDNTPEMRAKAALDALKVDPEHEGAVKAWKDQRTAAEKVERERLQAEVLAANPDAKGLAKGQLLAKSKREISNKVEAYLIQWDRDNPKPTKRFTGDDADAAIIADSFGYKSVDEMLQAIDAYGPRKDAIDSITQRRMLEEHGDLVDEDAIKQAANEAVHNEARARSLASELRTQREMLGARTDTGEVNAAGAKITTNTLVEAAKQFGAQVVGRTPLVDLKNRAWQHTAAERRAAKRWAEATAAGKTEEAVKAKQDQLLNNAAAKAALEARTEAQKILDFFRRVAKGNNEDMVEKGRDPDVVNAARAVLAAYGVKTPTTKTADAYLDLVAKHDPETYNIIKDMVAGALKNAQPLDALTYDQLAELRDDIDAMWHLAKRMRQMEVAGDLIDIQEAADDLHARMVEKGIPDTVPGEAGAVTKAQERARWLQFARALLRRVEQWTESMDGKTGGPFSRFVFQPIKQAADAYRTDRSAYRKKFQALVDSVAPALRPGLIEAPELGYTFGMGHNGIGHAELLHAILHTGNDSNKRKLLLGRQWATETAEGVLDTTQWDMFINRLIATGVLTKAHYDFAQGVWDLLEETKPLAQKAHRDVFGRYFDEVTANEFITPFGTYRGGYVPAQADPLLVHDADLRALAELESENMAYSFPTTSKGFTKSRVEYNRPLKLDLRTIPQHLDKVLLFSHMEPAVRGVTRLLRQKGVSQGLSRIDPAAYSGMLLPWLNRSARQQVETPVMGDGRVSRVLSTLRSRAGAALMFANVSNAVQQVTGLSNALVLVKGSHLMNGVAQMIAHPKQTRAAVATASPYMAERMSHEVAAMNDAMHEILLNPSLYEKAQAWAMRHSYFLQTAMDNALGPMVWTGAYNQALAEGMADKDAVAFADGVVRKTQGSTMPEDVSRIETGPAYARVFTQFIGYFNMMANTNGTALAQIAGEMGLKRGAGKALGVVFFGMLAPIWVAEAIAQAFKGGPDDPEGDGYLDDWLAAVFGMGTIKGMLAQVPFVAQLGQVAVNRFNKNPADDRFSLSPAVSLLESASAVPYDVYKAITDEANAQRLVRDSAALVSVATGLPASAIARPLGYAAGVADGKIDPTSPVDAARGLVTGVASPESKNR